MDKKLIIVISILIFFLALILIINSYFGTKPQDIPAGNCTSIPDKYNQYLCYVDLAVELKNPEICENIIENSYWKGDCLSFVASAKGDWEICNKVPNGEQYQQVCLSDVISATNNSELCEKINESLLGGMVPSICLPCLPNCFPRE